MRALWLAAFVAGCGRAPAAGEAVTPAPVEPVGSCPAPVEIDTGGEVVEIALGNFHGCARLRTGAIRCWGMNTNGQLGDGTRDNRHLPIAPTNLRDVIGIAAGGNATCAIVEGGAVWCWGHEISGLFGATHEVLVPTEIPALAGATQITLAFAHWCARFADGTARCSGDPESGGTPAAGITGVAEIAAGYSFSCARGDDGRVRCWGWNGDGRLGGATDAERTGVPAPVPGLDDVEGIAAGFGTACAWRGDGSVWCWGSSGYGLLGDGTGDDAGGRATPGRVPELACAIDITMAEHNACARTGDGRTHCWGSDSGTQERRFPACAHDGARDLSGCEDGFCFETDPEVFCEQPAPLATTGIAQIATGMLVACALVSGDVLCWGSNFYGGIGDGTGVDRGEPTRVRVHDAP